MRIGILHSYQLSGSGSCVYVRSLGAALGRLSQAHEVHVISAEPEPKTFPEVWRAYEYRDGERRQLFRLPRKRGAFTSHVIEQPWRPIAYPRAEMDPARTPLFTDLTDAQMEEYLSGLVERVDRIVALEGIEVLHANHTGPNAVTAARIRERRGIPYIVTVHGTFFEYVVRKDRRFLPWAREGLANADVVIALNEDVTERILSVQPGIEDRIVILPVGVDLELFAPLLPGRARKRIGLVSESIAESSKNGMDERTRNSLHAAATRNVPAHEIVESVKLARSRYTPTHADLGLPERLRRIDWGRTQTVAYLGKLLVDKGVHCLLAAAPYFLTRHPNAQLLIIGNGSFREGLEMLSGAILHRNRGFVDSLDTAARQLGTPGGLPHLTAAFPRELPEPPACWLDRIVFCGYLTTAQIAQLMPLCHVSVVPSLVPEAFPLVVLEAASCGVLPIGTAAGGLRDVLGSMQRSLGTIGQHMIVRQDPEGMVRDLGEKISAALDDLGSDAVAKTVRRQCRQFAEEGFSWDSVAARLGTILGQIAQDNPRGPRTTD